MKKLITKLLSNSLKPQDIRFKNPLLEELNRY